MGISDRGGLGTSVFAGALGELPGEILPWGKRRGSAYFLVFTTVCDKIATLSDAEYYYVQHTSSAMHNFRGLKKFNLPYKALEETIRKIQKFGISNSPEFYELFVLRILATCYFDLSRGAERNKKRETVQLYLSNIKCLFSQVL